MNAWRKAAGRQAAWSQQEMTFLDLRSAFFFSLSSSNNSWVFLLFLCFSAPQKLPRKLEFEFLGANLRLHNVSSKRMKKEKTIPTIHLVQKKREKCYFP